jgi:hypothetical protein
MAYRRKYLLDCEIAAEEAKRKWKWKLGWSPLTVGLWAAGAALVCGAVALAVMRLSGGPPIPGPPSVTREEFGNSVRGKTREEVTQAFGPPAKSGPDFVQYNWLTHDPSTRKRDGHVTVNIDEKTGRCVSVTIGP